MSPFDDAQVTLSVLLGELYDKLSHIKDLITRDIQLPNAPNKIKVVIGMRHTGKTYFIYQQILKLINEGIDKTCILYINFEDDRLLPLDHVKCAQLIEAFYTLYPANHQKKCYLFFDEIQNVDNWPLVVRRLSDSKYVEIYLTGSSAKLLSTEIATSLRGRSLSIEIWPYSFSEFIRAKKVDLNKSLYDKRTQDILKSLFRSYLSEGGFPEVVDFSPSTRQQTLQEYIDITLYRDIVERHAIKHPTLIKYMILTMIRNAGKPFTLNKFYTDLRRQGYRIGKDILYDYAHYIEDAYAAFFVALYDTSIRKVYTNPKKLYTIDPGIIRAVTFDYDGDCGRLFENVIYVDLRRNHYKIHYYLTTERYEIDFLVRSPQGHEKLIQVVWDAQDKTTLDRKQRALELSMRELKIEGEIITLDSYLHKGVMW
jgi:uncharacterized protein